MSVTARTTKDIDLGRLSAGQRLEFTFTINGVAWTGIDSVTLTLEKPDRSTTLTRTMILSSGAVWYYDLTAADLPDDETVDGYWTVGVEVVDWAITMEYPYEIGFSVRSEP